MWTFSREGIWHLYQSGFQLVNIPFLVQCIFRLIYHTNIKLVKTQNNIKIKRGKLMSSINFKYFSILRSPKYFDNYLKIKLHTFEICLKTINQVYTKDDLNSPTPHINSTGMASETRRIIWKFCIRSWLVSWLVSKGLAPKIRVWDFTKYSNKENNSERREGRT